MQITRELAEQSLQDIDSTMTKARAMANLRGGPWILMVWGGVWFVCFTLTHFTPRYAGWVWLIGDSIGFIVSLVVGFGLYPKPVVKSKSDKKLGWRIFWF